MLVCLFVFCFLTFHLLTHIVQMYLLCFSSSTCRCSSNACGWRRIERWSTIKTISPSKYEILSNVVIVCKFIRHRSDTVYVHLYFFNGYLYRHVCMRGSGCDTHNGVRSHPIVTFAIIQLRYHLILQRAELRYQNDFKVLSCKCIIYIADVVCTNSYLYRRHVLQRVDCVLGFIH